MRSSAPVSPTTSAHIIHAALVLGVLLFWLVAWYVGSRTSVSISALPDHRVLYIALFLLSGAAFGAAMFTAARLTPPERGASPDEWWRANLGRVIGIWALVETPAVLGIVAYLLTRDFRAMLAPFAGLLLFVNYRPRRFTER